MTARPDQDRFAEDGGLPLSASPDYFLPPAVLWESWSLNGEACVDGLLQPSPGCHRLAHCLMWLVHGYASRCRRTFDGTGVLAFVYHGPRTLTTMAVEMSLRFDLAIQDPALIREHLRHRGCKSAPAATPGLWLEGATHQYLVRGGPIPRGRVPRQKLFLLAEEHQVRVPAMRGSLRDGVLRKWSIGLDALASIDEATVASIIASMKDEQGFLANVLVLVHEQPGKKPYRRPTLEESWRRHADLVAQLASVEMPRDQRVVWHALWRLPPGLSWADPAGTRWMRYPAVSFVVGGKPIAGDVG